MATSAYVCQGGCGGFEEDISQMSPRGYVNEKLYCGKCVVEIDEYLAARDELHTRLAEKWTAGLAELSRLFAVGGRKLPDA